MKTINSKLLNSTKSEGFSLIELIVVITIIVIVSTIALVSYGSVNKKARDSRRMADLQKIAISLEMAKQVGTTYPDVDGATLLPAGLIPTYLSVMPKDPKSGSYGYTVFNNNFSYSLMATMEDLGSTTGTYAGGWNYKIDNP